MAWDKRNYPPEWKSLVAAIRERSGNRCEAIMPFMRRCNAPNGRRIHRFLDEPETYVFCTSGSDLGCYCLELSEPLLSRAIRVVLTSAHVCQDSLCSRLDHLSHECQLHHLRRDAQQHGRNALETKRRKRIEAGQGELLRV